jgi:ribonucleoside-diphosphate reductase alpha chain
MQRASAIHPPAAPVAAIREPSPAVEQAPIQVSENAVVRPIELVAAPTAKELDAPLCYQCGSKMQPAGSCYVCSSCGATSGCS